MKTAEKIAYIERVRSKFPGAVQPLPVWLCWKSVPNKDDAAKKPRKLPFYSNGKMRGKNLELDGPEDRAQLVPFEEAAAAFQLGSYTGLGVALGRVPGSDLILSGIDLDDVKPEDPKVIEVVTTAASYDEISPSETGLKIFGTGALETVKHSEHHLEIYGEARYFTVTGKALNGSGLADLRAAAAVAKKLFLPAPTEKPAATVLQSGERIGPGAHNHLLTIGGRWRRAGLDADELLAAMLVYNDKHCDPPKPDKEIREIAEFCGKKDAPKIVPAFELLGPGASTGTYDEWHGVPFESPNIVTQFLPEDAGGSVGPGGAGKSTLALYESVLIALGRPVYGRDVERQGATLLVTAEDRRKLVFSRLNKICHAMLLTADEIEQVRGLIHVEDVTGFLVRLVQADKDGSVHPGILFEDIIAKYATARLAQTIVDPTSLLGPGESLGNDGLSSLLRLSRVMSIELKSGVRLIHHVGQGVSRNEIQDQYAARGGTAFVDNSRFQHQIITVTKRSAPYADWGTFRVPDAASDTDLKKGRVLAILVHKLSYEERERVPIFILREGWKFTHLPALEGDMTTDEFDKQTVEDVERLRAFLRTKWDAGVRYITATQMEDAYVEEFKMPRPRLRKAIKEAGSAIVQTDLPLNERRGGKKHYLHPADQQEM